MMRNVEAAGHSVMSFLMPFVGGRRNRRKSANRRSKLVNNLESNDVIKKSLRILLKDRESADERSGISKGISTEFIISPSVEISEDLESDSSEWKPVLP